MAKPISGDHDLANKIRRDGMMRVGSSVDSIAAYREEREVYERERVLAAVEACIDSNQWEWDTRSASEPAQVPVSVLAELIAKLRGAP